MEKYHVTNVDNQDTALAQKLELQHDKTKTYKQVVVPYSISEIPIGTKVKAYEIKGGLDITMAYSYKVNNMRYVALQWRPATNYGIKKFWNDLGYFDCVRLNADIKQALRQRGVVPALNKNTNLRLFLIKTL